MKITYDEIKEDLQIGVGCPSKYGVKHIKPGEELKVELVGENGEELTSVEKNRLAKKVLDSAYMHNRNNRDTKKLKRFIAKRVNDTIIVQHPK